MPLISSTINTQHKATKTAGPSSGVRKTNEKKVSCRHHRTSLQTLPAKLKNKIYEYVLFSGHQYANLTPPAIYEVSKDVKSIHLSGNPVLLHVWGTSKLHLLGGKTREIAARLVDNAKFDVAAASKTTHSRPGATFILILVLSNKIPGVGAATTSGARCMSSLTRLRRGSRSSARGRTTASA